MLGIGSMPLKKTLFRYISPKQTKTPSLWGEPDPKYVVALSLLLKNTRAKEFFFSVHLWEPER
jgi:hypothetical protein